MDVDPDFAADQETIVGYAYNIYLNEGNSLTGEDTNLVPFEIQTTDGYVLVPLGGTADDTILLGTYVFTPKQP